MYEKSGSSGVISSNASSVTFSMYIAGYTLEIVFLQIITDHHFTSYRCIRCLTKPASQSIKNTKKIKDLHYTYKKQERYVYLERALLAETNHRANSRRVHKSPG